MRGAQGLAYEIVINSNPCIAYLMEDNTLMMQALVIAHASYGHNSFFKGNYLFRQSTEADGILDYLVFARRYVLECEERHGVAAVEDVLDSCHALMRYGVDRYKRAGKLSLAKEKARAARRASDQERLFNDLWRTLPAAAASPEAAASRALPGRTRGERPLLHREELAQARDLAAGAGAHRAQALAVFLSRRARPRS